VFKKLFHFLPAIGLFIHVIRRTHIIAISIIYHNTSGCFHSIIILCQKPLKKIYRIPSQNGAPESPKGGGKC
jgi:hypothetical protein